jgi:hypothetical protein
MSTRAAVVVTFPEPAAVPREVDPAPSKFRPPRPRPPRAAKPAAAPVPFGAVLTKKERPLFWKVLSGDQNLPPLALKILQRMVTYYDGELGIVMSYESLARDVGCTPRWVKAQVKLLSQLGIVEVLRGQGVWTRRGPTNRFVVRWPEQSPGYEAAHVVPRLSPRTARDDIG